MGWNPALERRRKAGYGPGQSGGIVTIHSKTQKITRCCQYWAFAHYSKIRQRGAGVLASRGHVTDFEHVVVKKPDGSNALVLTNGGLDRLTRAVWIL